ncbi:MAG: hypothetical protein ACU4EQ_00290 [Candidatus Nitrosoglobus sp.]|jgi:uncharacterized membrane protein YgdD (TMEM256/DUF423 family)
MSRLEEALLSRWSGLKIMAVSAALGFAGILPLLLYIAFGPADGNPIGLGLLAMVTAPIGGMGIIVGFVRLLVQYFRRYEK